MLCYYCTIFYHLKTIFSPVFGKRLSALQDNILNNKHNIYLIIVQDNKFTQSLHDMYIFVKMFILTEPNYDDKENTSIASNCFVAINKLGVNADICKSQQLVCGLLMSFSFSPAQYVY